MTFEQYAKKEAQKIIDHPFRNTIIDFVNNINSLRVDGKPINDEQINIILNLLEIELGDLELMNESFDNSETLTLISQVRKLIAQTQQGK